MIYEIRSYHFSSELFEQYKKWIQSGAITYLKNNLDIIGFWIGTENPSEVQGTALDSLGSANVTWIIRWRDMNHRNAVFPEVFSRPEWLTLFSTNPGGLKAYLRAESKFMEKVG